MKYQVSYVMDEVGYSEVLSADNEKDASELVVKKLTDQYPNSVITEMLCSKYQKQVETKVVKKKKSK